MPFLQPKVTPLPPGIDLTGKSAVVTGASAGLGLETARQLLTLNLTTLILAVRNESKGATCIKNLLQDPAIKSKKPTIKVLKLDVNDNNCITTFSKTLPQTLPTLDILILNAGISRLKHNPSPSGHEESVQVNYLSNALLLAELLPYLNASAEKTGSPTRITWLGSRMHQTMTSFPKKSPLDTCDSVLEYMDGGDTVSPLYRYADSKVLCAMFMYSLAPRLDASKIMLNMVCPGMVDTAISDFLPIYWRLPVNLVKAVRARSVEAGGWLIVNAAVVAGPESHGRFLEDKEVLEVSKYIRSEAGKNVQEKLWEETMDELKKLTTLPREFE
ncbi:short-chain dehydrogenase/reductase family protein [Penicillium subrubescens]|uniref:Short-chain dehydrogenase TIC 32, chloroplastic n=1 Tax=Penicillium subrubescens TaxID=1316194 RepID=A0A1Q5SSI3_9EURO|nr:short-chain dehydrogenase/reductase family protein [Penicillium subrubescens]KAJ5891242.1 short-chain dehydrogenase/reductase family protein [Penicillium subrubescens]OKO90923.1 Short-chain dehydrogenase TIC 32, chloroplastic [Penicillium subrubescens]